MLLLILSVQLTQGQVDNSFWFVAPEISNDHGDRPIYFNITTFDQPANVTISMPANNTFSEINLLINANSTHRENVTPFIGLVENRYRTDYDPAIPGKNNNGILIESDVEITVYYESAAPVNSDLFALKGRNALGSHFFTPFQTRYFNNSGSNWDDPAYSAFDIVFTEDNTYITLDIPSGKAVYNNGTGWTGTVRLGPFNRGETFSGIPVWLTSGIKPSKNSNDVFGRIAQDHLSGVEIQAHDISGTRTRRIAVTIKDDSMRGFKGSAYDTGGDQIVPVDITGKEYIALKGELREGNVQNHYSKPPAPSWARQEAVFILATENSTQLTVRGNNLATLNKGETYTLELEHDFTHIMATAPIYVWQVTGFGDEMGSAILPAIDRCTGSEEVAFTRSQTGWDFYLTILVRNGAQGGFLLNGSANTVLGASKFQNVTGTSFWKAAVIGPVSTSDVLELQQNVIQNSIDLFHVGIIMGSGSGCRYGYFSDFGETPQIKEAPLVDGLALCAGTMELKVTDESGYSSYQWYKNGQALTGENTGSLIVSDPGRYKVTALTTCNGTTTETFPSNEIDAIPCISVNDPSVTEGTPNAVFTIKISDQLPVDVIFDYETIEQTATKTKDYISTKGSAIIKAGEDSCNIFVPIVQDDINEPIENVNLRIRNASNVNISDSVGICALIDDGDAEPYLDIPETIEVDEHVAGGKLNVTFKLSKESGYTVTSDYQILDISAIINNDYKALKNGSISFLPGEMSKSLSIDILDDNIYEPSEPEGYEKFLVIATNIEHGAANNDSLEVRIIENEEVPELNISPSTITEGDTLDFMFTLNRACDENITTNIKAKDITATNGSDYLFETGIQTIAIPAGKVTFKLKIPSSNDILSEGNETFQLIVNNPLYASISGDSIIVTGTITDANGLPQLYIDDVTASEGDTIEFNPQLSIASASEVSFDVNITYGKASASDFSGISFPIPVVILPDNKTGSIKIPLHQDTEEEGVEDFKLHLTNLSGNIQMLDNEAQGTILDDDETPEAKNDTYSIEEDASAPLSGNVTDNDIGLGDDPITVALFKNTSHGALSIISDGRFSYQPFANYHGDDKFNYILTDVDGDKDTALVNISIISTNDIPVAVGDSYNLYEKTHPSYTPMHANIMDNDSGLGDTIEIIQLSNPDKGTLSLSPNGDIQYNPDEQNFGIDQFTYKLEDKDNDQSDVTAVNIQIEYYNDAAPVANDDHYSTPQNSELYMSVFSNDTDVDGSTTLDKKSIHVTEHTSNGTLTNDPTTGMLAYAPDTDFAGADSFKYTIADVKIDDQPVKRSTEASVYIEVTTDNQSPVAVCKDIMAYLGSSGSITVNASDINRNSYDDDVGDVISLSIEGAPNITFDCQNKGMNEVNLTVTDNHLAAATCISQVTVVDTISPIVIDCQSDTTIYCGPSDLSQTVNYLTPTFADNCDGDNISGILKSGAPSGSSFGLGENVIEYFYVDNAENDTAYCTFSISIIQDNEPPVITGLTEQSVTVNKLDNTYHLPNSSLDPSVNDNVGVESMTHDFGAGGSTLEKQVFNEGEHLITWTASDKFGNTTIHEFTLTVNPKFTVNLSSDKTDNEVCEGQIITFHPTITDGTAPYQYRWVIDGINATGWINDNHYTSASFTDSQTMQVLVRDNDGYEYFSNQISVTVLSNPDTGNLLRIPNK